MMDFITNHTQLYWEGTAWPDGGSSWWWKSCYVTLCHSHSLCSLVVSTLNSEAHDLWFETVRSPYSIPTQMMARGRFLKSLPPHRRLLNSAFDVMPLIWCLSEIANYKHFTVPTAIGYGTLIYLSTFQLSHLGSKKIPRRTHHGEDNIQLRKVESRSPCAWFVWQRLPANQSTVYDCSHGLQHTPGPSPRPL